MNAENPIIVDLDPVKKTFVGKFKPNFLLSILLKSNKVNDLNIC